MKPWAAYFIARKIARRGVEPRRPFERAAGPHAGGRGAGRHRRKGRPLKLLAKLLGLAVVVVAVLFLAWLFITLGEEISNYRGVNE
ncbi:MAG TPA: hypothetical protein VK422_16950 [Pyrinomonadaceae bacterium]|nr:hypothetical protein [Pyrinomonadaceae bacterium]